MASYPGGLAEAPVIRVEILGRAPGAYDAAGPPVPPKLIADVSAILPGIAVDAAAKPAVTPTQYLGGIGESSTVGLDFYERFHVLVREIELGNLLAATSIDMEVFSAFRTEAMFWLTAVNNAGDGVTLTGLPSLPVLVAPQGYYPFTVDVTLDGPAVVDSTIDFTFNSTGLISVPISLQRVILLSLSPETGYDETLEWLTDVMQSTDATEQRVAVRSTPRQSFDLEFFAEDGIERTLLETQLFARQAGIFGIPLWHQAATLAADVTGGSTLVIDVGSTDYADWRDGGLFVIWESQTKFDVLDLASHDSTSLTAESVPSNSYSAGQFVLVAPLRLSVIDGPVRGARYRTGHDRFRARFRVKEAGVDLADTGAFSSLSGKVLLDDCNFVDGTIAESFEQDVVVLDGRVGLTEEWSRADRHRRVSQKRWVAKGRQEAWELIQLLHALRGRQVSFWLPTFSSDMIPTATMTSGLNTLQIAYMGYTTLIDARQPKNVIRVVPVSGSPFIRTIQSSTAPSATSEIITISSTWPTTLTPEQIDRIEFVEKVRLDSDSLRIEHRSGGVVSALTAPVRTVLE